MQAVSANEPKQFQVYGAFTQLQQQGKLKSLKDAEKLLSTFGADINNRNVIKFNLQGADYTHQECLYEYNIPHGNGTYSTFYVDHNLGFECGERLPESYKDTILDLHLSIGQSKNKTTHTIH